MRILDVPQYSPEWWAARAGVPTASNADRILTAAGKPSSSQSAYMAELIDEIVRPRDERPSDEQSFGGNRHTERGNELEPKARAWHSLVTGQEIKEVGMIFRDDGLVACSPDGLIVGPDGVPLGGGEYKAPEGKKHVLWMIENKLPDEHKQQVHFSLAVSGLPFWEFVSHCPGYKPFRIRVTPDDYTAKMAAEIDAFAIKLKAAKEQFIDYINARK